MVEYYSKYNNTYVKHNDNIIEEEVELFDEDIDMYSAVKTKIETIIQTPIEVEISIND